MEKEVANLTLEISKAKQEEFEAQEELLETRRELDEANQQIDQLKVISYQHAKFILRELFYICRMFCIQDQHL